MTDTNWASVLDQLEVTGGVDVLRPVASQSLDAAETSLGVKLPASYRFFCGVFGAGDFGRGEFNIAVPGYEGDTATYSLEYLTRSQRELAGQFGEVGLDAKQLERGVFFATDMAGSNHFFDPEDVTDADGREYAVYSLFRNYEIGRTFENFREFITRGCLGDRRNYLLVLDDDESLEQTFKPVAE